MLPRVAIGILILSVGILVAVFWLASVQEQSTANQSLEAKIVRTEARGGSLPDLVSPIGRQPSSAKRATTSPRPMAQIPAGSSPYSAPPGVPPTAPSQSPVDSVGPDQPVEGQLPSREVEAGISEGPQGDSNMASPDVQPGSSASGFAASVGGGSLGNAFSSGGVPMAGDTFSPGGVPEAGGFSRALPPDNVGQSAGAAGSGSGALSSTQNPAVSLSQGEALQQIFTAMTTYSQEGSTTLETFLVHQDPEVRRSAVEAIKQVRTESSAKALRAAAKQASSEEERDYLLQAADFVELPAYVPRSRRSAN